MNFEEEISLIRKDIRKFRQATNEHKRRLAKIHNQSQGGCLVFSKFKRAGFSDLTSDQMCRMASKYGVSSRLTVGEIMTAIKIASKVDGNGVGFQDNSSNSKGPGNGVPDKDVTSSSMGNDYESCLKGLKDLGIDESRSVEECSTQWLGKGTRYGDNEQQQQKKIARSQLPVGVRLSSGGKTVSVKGASVENEPHWLTVQEFMHNGGTDNHGSNVRSAAKSNPEEHAKYMRHVMESHDQAVERRDLDEYTTNVSKTKSASTKDKRPHWIKTREHLFKD